jgi:hypothetical protein
MKLKMMRLSWLCILSLSGIFSLQGQPEHGAPSPDYNYSVFNWGFRLGVNALSNSRCDWSAGETGLVNVPSHNKSGYDVHAFGRINLDRFFMQPELGWSLYKQAIAFSSENPDYQETGLSLSTQTANINVFAGYYMIKNELFLFSLICGSSLQYHFNTRFSADFPKSEFWEKSPHLIPYGMVGFSISIARAYFDMKYGFNIFDIDINFDKIQNRPASLSGVSLQKRENILNFSCGLMF